MQSKKFNSEHIYIKYLWPDSHALLIKKKQIRLLINSNFIIILVDRNMADVKVKGWIEKVEETLDSQSDDAPLSSKETKNILTNSGVNYCWSRST